jgi:membrane-bound lytic murein transglycosylase D
VAEPAAAAVSPWQSLRERFVLQGCDYRPQVLQRARNYTNSPQRFAASWKAAMPFLLLVLDEIERRDLPGELAMLPYVESHYRPVASRGNNPAGIWQLMPDTARTLGLAINAGYDGRLDPYASTHAALDLLERHDRRFNDWRVADMAFNSGAYRVLKVLGGRDARTLSAAELAQLPLSRITHEHLDRVLALACIVANPARFHVVLPEPGADDRLQRIELQAGMDLRLAARLAGVAADDIRRWNAGYRHNRMGADVPHQLLLPAINAERFQSAASAVPAALWSDWREERAARTSAIGSWASQLGVPIAVLALANAVDERATVTSSTRLLLPGREPEPVDGTPDAAARRARVHVVAAGDTLSGIARRHSMPLRKLKALNPRANGTLQIGDKLLLDADTG